LGGLHVRGARDDAHRAHLAHGGGRHDDRGGETVVAVAGQGVHVGHTYRVLAGAHQLGRGAAGGRELPAEGRDALQARPAFVPAQPLELVLHEQVGGGGGRRVGEDDLALVGGVDEVVPRAGQRLVAVELAVAVLVDADAEGGQVEARPVAVGVGLRGREPL